MFEPFRCEDCIHGEYDEQEREWDCLLGCWSSKECEDNYEDDEKMQKRKELRIENMEVVKRID